jgi:probable F420-dependent oxidoreductase
VRFSVNAFGLKPALYRELAVKAEQVGAEALWLSDHLVTPARFDATYPYDASGRPGYGLGTPLNDAWVLMGHLGALTTRLRLGTGVFILPLRNPVATALAVATAQRLTGGRVLLGVGAGWMREEFDAVGEDFDRRGPRLDECLDILEGLFTRPEFSYDGKFYRLPPVGLGGEPVGPVPVIVGGVTEAALRRAERRADGWFGPVCPLDESLAVMNRLRERRPDIALYPRLVGPIGRITFDAYAERGVEHVVVSLGPLLAGRDSPAARAEALEEVASFARQA